MVVNSIVFNAAASIKFDGILYTYYLLLLLKPAAQALVRKTMLLLNCFHNATSTCATENWRKHNSGKQPTVDCILEPIEPSGVKHSVGKVIPQSNLSRELSVVAF